MFRIIPRIDGSIVYAADLMGAPDEPRAALYSVPVGGEPSRMIPEPGQRNADVHAWASDPMVAPDGVTLAYCSDRERPYWYDVCVTTDDGGEVHGLVGEKSRYNRYAGFLGRRPRPLH